MTIKNGLLMAALGMGLGVWTVGCGGATPPAVSPPDMKAPTTTSATADSDGDGIPDATDKCPDKKEDGQAPDPKDGCPKS